MTRTIEVPTVRNWLALAPAALHAAVALAARSRLTALLRIGRVRAFVVGALGRLSSREGEWAIAVEVTGARGGYPVRRFASRCGLSETAATARVAEFVTKLVLEGKEPHGVLHIEQLEGWRSSSAKLFTDETPWDLPRTYVDAGSGAAAGWFMPVS